MGLKMPGASASTRRWSACAGGSRSIDLWMSALQQHGQGGIVQRSRDREGAWRTKLLDLAMLLWQCDRRASSYLALDEFQRHVQAVVDASVVAARAGNHIRAAGAVTRRTYMQRRSER